MFLSITVTNRCNFRCGHCLRGEAGQIDMDYDLFREIVEQANDGHRLSGVCLMGGEVGLHPRFEDMMKFVLRKGVEAHFITNGSLPDRYEIVEKCPDRIGLCVSLDGATAETHDALRKDGSFDMTVKYLESLPNKGLHADIFTVVSQLNKHQIPEILKFTDKPWCKLIKFIAVIDRPWNGHLTLSEEEKEEAECIIRKNGKKRWFQFSPSWGEKSGRCKQQTRKFNGLAIDVHGRIVFCADILPSVGFVADLNYIPLSEGIEKRKAMVDKYITDNDRKKPWSCEICHEYFERINQPAIEEPAVAVGLDVPFNSESVICDA